MSEKPADPAVNPPAPFNQQLESKAATETSPEPPVTTWLPSAEQEEGREQRVSFPEKNMTHNERPPQQCFPDTVKGAGP